MLPKKVLIPMAAVALVVAGAYGASRTSAAADPNGGQVSLVQKIADTFHLDKSKVQAVFDQNRADRQAQAETRYEQKLSQAVTDGQLTPAQKAAVLSEHNQLKTELDAAAAKSGTDRRAALKQIRTEATDWAKQNHISAHWLLGPRPLRDMGPGKGMMHQDNDGDAGNTSPAPTPSTSPSASPSVSPS
jgi:hypothetical protein